MTHAVKVIEIISESEEGWEQAAREAIAHVSQTVRNIKTIWIESQQGVVEDNKIVKYRVTAKVSFVVDEGMHHG